MTNVRGSPAGAVATRTPLARAHALLAGDARNVARDPLLVLSLVLPLLLGLALRWGFPWIDGLFPTIDIGRYARFATGFMLVQSPLLVGFVAGFMLLDERDEGVLSAIAVTPLGATRFLTYRLILPAAVSFPAALAVIALSGLDAPPLSQLAGAALLAAAEAPLTTLFLAAFAANKVEGLALAKASGLAVAAPFAALLVPPPWQWLAGVFPQYWAVGLFLTDHAAAGTAYAAAGIAVHTVWTLALLRAFRRRGAR